MSRVYAGIYHITGTVEDLGLEGVGDYEGVVDSDVLLVDDYELDTETNMKGLVDIIDLDGKRVPAYVALTKLQYVKKEPVERVPGWQDRAYRTAYLHDWPYDHDI